MNNINVKKKNSITMNVFKNIHQAARRACRAVNFFKKRAGDTEIVSSAGLLRRNDVAEAGGRRTLRAANFFKNRVGDTELVPCADVGEAGGRTRRAVTKA